MAIKEKSVLLLLTICCIFQFVLNKKIFFDKEAILLLSGMFFYGIIGKFTAYVTLKLVLIPLLFYLFGKSLLILQDPENCEYRTKILIIVLSLCLLAGSILNAVTRSFLGLDQGRRWGEFWTRSILPATQLAFYDLFIIGLMFYGIYGCIKKRWLNSILVIGGLWSLWFSLITNSRMQAVIFTIVFISNILLFCYLNRNKTGFRYGRILFWGLVILCISAILSYIFNIGGLAEYMKSSMWARNGGILHNVRFQSQILALKQLFKYPLGGKQMDLGGLRYFHNVWLDMANTAGLLPFTLIAVYTVITLYNLIMFIRKQTISQETKYLLVSSYLSLFLYYMVEPALDANIIYWSIWMFVCGMIKGTLQNNNYSLNRE